jgi:hypothetical protein
MKNHDQNEIAHFTMPKVGEQEIDIQDACCYSSDCTIAAIADGASTSLWPREWANLLVEGFCRDNQESIVSIYKGWEEWLRPLQERWRQHSLKIKKDPNIPWYAQGSRDKDHGSATFVGLKLQPSNQDGKKNWEVLAVGDSCLFKISAKSSNLVCFPLSKSEQFKTVTDCFHSLPEYNYHKPLYIEDFYESGDIFLLATDALAEWIIKDCEKQSNRWRKLISVATLDEFTDFINQLRDDKLIKNDDTTLLRLKVVIPEGKKTDRLDPKRSNSKPPNRENKRLPLIIVAIIGIGFITTAAIYFSFFNDKKINNANLNQNSPLSKVATPEKTTPTVNNTPTSNNSSLLNDQKFPIYSAESNNEVTIGYVFKKASELESFQLWVQVTKDYLFKTEKADQYIMIIPLNATPLPLYIDKPEPKYLSPQDFAGYLLPGKYSVFQPKESRIFKDTHWVKINFRFKNKGG